MTSKTLSSKNSYFSTPINGVSNFVYSKEELTSVIINELDNNMRFACLFGTDDRETKKGFGVHVLLANDKDHSWKIISSFLDLKNPSYPSLTRFIQAAAWSERYIYDMFGINPEGHPDLRRIVHHENIPLNTYPLRKDFAWNSKLKKDNVSWPFNHIEGESIYEIPVGPIHAGIIEPGHFRFGVAGERVITLDAKLFFTHKGLEKILEGKDIFEALPFIEGVSGDSSATHVLAFNEAVEKISNTKISKTASLLRTLISELERLTMHIHDIANIAGMGTGYTIMAANCFRIKERLMRLSKEIFGNRFWRGFILPGGVKRQLSFDELDLIKNTVNEVLIEIKKFTSLAKQSSSLGERLETTGILSLGAAKDFGALGIAARSSGLEIDVRKDHPYASYEELDFPIVVEKNGDVLSRYNIRVEEIPIIVNIIDQVIIKLKKQKKESFLTSIKVIDGISIGAAESFRGEVIYIVKIENNKIDRIIIRDPSFLNWPLFSVLVPGNIVPDFPLCNKTLNLSYSGTDL